MTLLCSTDQTSSLLPKSAKTAFNQLPGGSKEVEFSDERYAAIVKTNGYLIEMKPFGTAAFAVSVTYVA